MILSLQLKGCLYIKATKWDGTWAIWSLFTNLDSYASYTVWCSGMYTSIMLQKSTHIRNAECSAITPWINIHVGIIVGWEIDRLHNHILTDWITIQLKFILFGPNLGYSSLQHFLLPPVVGGGEFVFHHLKCTFKLNPKHLFSQQ